jgi:hypothetical protein
MNQVDFTETDFAKCKYNPLKPNLFGLHPELKVIYSEVEALSNMDSYVDWQAYISPEKLMGYVILCYHKPSPLIARIAELRERKIQALQLMEINLQVMQREERSKKILANILLSRHEFTTRLALHFLKHENSLIWSEYCKLLDYLEDAEYEMLNPNEGEEKLSSVAIAEKKSKVYSGIQKYRNDLNTLAEKLMQSDTEMQSYMSSQLIQLKRIKLIVPEDYVKLTQEELTEVFRQQRIL